MPIATSRNLTILGIATIIGAVAQLAVAIWDGNANTQPEWAATIAAIVAGIGMILAKGAQSTGGTVAETAEAVKRVNTP